MRNLYLSCAISTLALAVSGCGGTESSVAAIPPPPGRAVSSPATPAPVTTPVSQDFNTSEYTNSTSAHASNSISAWQEGASGAGVKIGFVDTGLNATNSEFAGKIDPASQNLAGNLPMSDDYGHGTATASIAAAAQDGSGIEGIAYGATIVEMKVDQPGSCPSNCKFDSSDIAEGIELATSAGAKVINLSLSGDATSSITNAVKVAAQSGIIFVVAAANDSSGQPSDFAKAVANAAQGQAIIVGALGQSSGNAIDYNALASFSNAAGTYENWYVAAPGYLVRVAYKTDSFDIVSGTSFAAPAVSGAVALLLQAFPNLAPKDVVQILLQSADDLGASGTDATFGRGKLNIGRAFQPIGVTTLAGSSVAISPAIYGTSPPAMGDALERGSLNAIVLDSYARAFKMNLALGVSPAAPKEPLRQMLTPGVKIASLVAGPFHVSVASYRSRPNQQDLFSEPSFRSRDPQRSRFADATIYAKLANDTSLAFGFGMSGKALEQQLRAMPIKPFINQDSAGSNLFGSRDESALVIRKNVGSLGFSASQESGYIQKNYAAGKTSRYHLVGISIDRSKNNTSFAVLFSRMDEDSTVLGGNLGSLFDSNGSKSLFASADVSYSFAGAWSVNATTSRGWTKFDHGSFTTSAYSFGITKSGIGSRSDQLSLKLSQPLRSETGRLSLSLPSAYNYMTETATYSGSHLSLQPSARELVAEAAYARPMRKGSAVFNVYARKHPGHSAIAETDFGGAVRLSLNF